MKNFRLKKALYLSALSTMLLTGCGKKEIPTTQEQIEVQIEENKDYNLNINVVSNQTVARIIDEYETKIGKKLNYSDIIVDVMDEPKYIWKDEEGNYVYDYNINIDSGYEYIDGKYSKMAVVKVNIHKNNKDWYMPICALFQYGSTGAVNVKVTTLDTKNRVHYPYKNYIYIENPTYENYRELTHYEEYLNAEYKEPAFYVAPKEYKYKNN